MSFILSLINKFYLIKMLKKLNEDAVTFKRLLQKRLSKKKIYQLLELKKHKISYWINHKIEIRQKRRKKLPQTYVKEICKMAKDKTTSKMGSKKIANLINETLKK